MEKIEQVRKELLARFDKLEIKADILKSAELKGLYAEITKIPAEQRKDFGQAVNNLKKDLEELVSRSRNEAAEKALPPIDVTAPFDVNSRAVELMSSEKGSIHPISSEISKMTDIFERMGFRVFGSREIDDQYHMFESLNFPKGHPARDDYDTFMTLETDKDGDPLIAPAHTSTMQNRILKEMSPALEKGEQIAAVAIDRVFRNEDIDARHEHTFYQHEGILVGKNISTGMLAQTLKVFLEEYYKKELQVRINPFYFPFTEPSFEFALSCPFCEGQDESCKVCSGEGWIELLGCGMIHPNVLRAAGIDPEIYTGFAWGGGVERLIMMKHQIEDIRHFESAKLDFLKQF